MQEAGLRYFTRREAIRLIGGTVGSGFVATGLAAPQQRTTRDRVTFPRGAIIRTVLKDVPPEALGDGATLFHEHLSMGLMDAEPREPNLVPLDVNARIEELRAAAKDGVRCVVSGGTIDLGQNVEDVKRIAMRSGVHVVVASGYWLQERYPPEIATKTEDQLADDLVSLATVERWGALGEIGMSMTMHRDERKVLRACGKVNLRTGLPIFTHTPHEGCRPCGLEQLDVLESVGVDPRHVCIGHLADIHDDPKAVTHIALARRGVFLGFDTVGRQRLGPPDSMKLRMLMEVLDAGYENNVLLSSDLGGLIREFKVNYGAGWGTVL